MAARQYQASEYRVLRGVDLDWRPDGGCPSLWERRRHQQAWAMPRERQKSSRDPGYRLQGIHGRVVSSIGEGIIKGRYAPESLLPR